MKPQILRNIFIATISVFICTAVACFWGFYLHFSAESREELDTRAHCIAEGVEFGGTQYLEGLDTDDIGGVVYVSDGEIYEYGQIEDYTQSCTVQIDGGSLTVYSDGGTPASLVVRLFPQMVFSLTFAIALSVIVSSRVAKNIIRPISDIDVANPDERDVYEELKPIVKKIASQNRKIHRQMAQLEEESEKRDRLRREFTANVSHELKTPLTSISGTAEIIRDGLVRPEDVAHFADNIHKEAARLIDLVGDIIKLSRLEDRAEEYEKSIVSLYSAALSVADRLSHTARCENVTVTVEGTEGKILAPERLIEEIVYNLADNAIKYNRDGGSVKITVTETEARAGISVEDSGIGIPPDELERVFERFYRVDKSRSKLVGGTGLGLSIVKHGVVYCNAEINIESTVGVGTAITVNFPKK